MFNGYVAYTLSFSADVSKPLALDNSALANPPPIKRMNNCLNTWKHLGSENKPYNQSLELNTNFYIFIIF